MRNEPLERIVRFPSMRAHATLQANKEAGGGRYELEGSGMMVFALRGADAPDRMAVTVRDLKIEFKPIVIEMPKSGRIEIPEFEVTTRDLDLDRTSGTWYSQDRQVKLRLAIRLDPARIPIMRKIGFTEPVTVVAFESGALDWEHGRRLETHAEPFTLPAPLDFLTVSPGQFDTCPISADLRVAADCGYAQDSRETEIWICPGDDACLAWQVSGSPTDVTLDPGLGAVADSGSQIVNPMSTTTYTVTGRDASCSDSDDVTVRVVREGEDIFTLTARWNPWESCVWLYELPAGLVGRSVRATRMRHVSCGAGGGTWPEWSFTHTDPDGHFFGDNVKLNEWADIVDQPLAGQWKFSPIGVDTCRPAEGTNGFEPACFEIELGCAR